MGKHGFKHHGKTVWPGFTEVPTRHVAKVGRNDPCPCGSGKKYKECHESAGSSYLEKLAHEEEKIRLKEMRRRMKEQGVPWYKRIFIRS